MLRDLCAIPAYTVELRREIAVRMALGANRADVFRLITGGGLKLTIWGAMIGIACDSFIALWA